ncbi:thioredoxin domain-containing protein [Duganella sp. S19_KUP01_CR8]|uniref:thioredoxin domain-containing protein n=1 Tax=Duganella sp. S19_KUP01_CR8 TaxID=3025502 RepID=UPI002FCD8BA7
MTANYSLPRRTITAFFAACLMTMAAAPHAQSPAEKPPAYRPLHGAWPAGEADVVEFFSYNCTYCYQAQPAVEELLRHKAAQFTFQRYAVSSSSQPGWKLSAQAFRAAQLAGIEDRVGPQLFERMQRKGGSFADLADVQTFFAAQPMGDAALKHLDTPEALALRKHIFELAKGIELDKTPTFVVGGRYVAFWGTDQTPDMFRNMILDLLKRARAEHASACAVQLEDDVRPPGLAAGSACK